MVIETNGETFIDSYVIASKLAIAGVAQDGKKTLTESADKQEIDAAIKIAREKIFALMLLNGANYQQYSKVRTALSNQFTQGVNMYLKTIKDALWLMNNYKTLRVK